jgi:hypothetical protein
MLAWKLGYSLVMVWCLPQLGAVTVCALLSATLRAGVLHALLDTPKHRWIDKDFTQRFTGAWQQMTMLMRHSSMHADVLHGSAKHHDGI